MVAKERGEELQAARSLLGPKGGLPTLKADLLRLATLLHVDVGPTETVEKIKQKLRPMVSTLKGTSATGTSPRTPTGRTSATRSHGWAKGLRTKLRALVGRVAGSGEPAGTKGCKPCYLRRSNT